MLIDHLKKVRAIMPNKETIRLILQAKRALESALMLEMGMEEKEDTTDAKSYMRSGKEESRRGRVLDPQNDKRVKYIDRYDV
jgi:hypothetical protein